MGAQLTRAVDRRHGKQERAQDQRRGFARPDDPGDGDERMTRLLSEAGLFILCKDERGEHTNEADDQRAEAHPKHGTIAGGDSTAPLDPTIVVRVHKSPRAGGALVEVVAKHLRA
jgi:hypothetical protein